MDRKKLAGPSAPSTVNRSLPRGHGIHSRMHRIFGVVPSLLLALGLTPVPGAADRAEIMEVRGARDATRLPDAYEARQSLTGVIDSDAAWGDFDGDGDLDLIVSGETDTGRVTRTYENRIDSLLLRQELVGIDGAGSGCVSWGDYDLDGDLDLAMAGTADTGRVAMVFENDGSGNLSHDGTQVLARVANASLAWGDFDRDGDLDLYLQGHDGTAATAVLYENDPPGTLVFHTAFGGLHSGSADWADWNGDGYLDLLVTGANGSTRTTIFYENDPLLGLTNDGSHGLPGFVFSDAAWGDCDNDGDLDLVVTGESGVGGPMHALIYANDGGGVLDSIAEPWQIYRSSCAWGDYDNDGDLDVAFCGYDGGSLMTDVLENDNGGFAPCGFGFPGVREGSVSFADADRDGDLDFFVTGANWTPKYARLYEKTGGAANTAPTAPTTFESHQYVSPFGWPDDVVFSWDGASDAETQSAGLYYLLRVGTSPGADDVVSGTYSTPLMGNAGQSKEVTLSGLPVQTYYWSVKAIDAGFMESGWAPEQICIPRELTRVTIDPADDAFVESFNPNTPFGAANPNWLVVGGYSGPGSIARSYLKFYIGPETPPGTDVVAAGLTVELMSVSCGSSYYIDVYEEGVDVWDENTITWNNAPTMFKPYASDRQRMTSPGPYTWDVTGDVRGTVDGNVTLVLRSGSPPEGTNCVAEYYSKEWYEAARRPFLTIWYASVYTGVEGGGGSGSDGGDAPPRLVLRNNRPNPFNPTTSISFALPERQEVDLSVYDISGRLVRTLQRGMLDAGEHDVLWDGRSSTGDPGASGVYFYRLTAGGETHTKKMILIR
ncbi:MAG: FG-GAP-like repeat-containing protein [Candidatus Eisenbacteria bacterium]